MLIPYILTIGVSGLLLILSGFLALKAWRERGSNVAAGSRSDPTEVRLASASRSANRWLSGARAFFLLVLLLVFGFHSYWVFFADSKKNSTFARAKVFDVRNRRLAESGLKGWVLDRSGKLENALIRYRYDGRALVREYPLGKAAVHLTGFSDFVYGAGGFEAAYRDWLTAPASTYNRLSSPVPVGQDITVSVDSSLQRDVFGLVEGSGKSSAAVVLLLPNNEVLAMASAPSFDPASIRDEDTWRELTEQAEDPSTQALSPLVNRALGTLVTGGPAFYYRPGSTFKTFVAAVALDTGVTNERFTCRGEGFTPPGTNRSIRDYGGEVHGTLGLRDAFRVSCNQYFAQLGLKLGKQRLAEYARRLHYVTDPGAGSTQTANLWQISHGSQDHFDFVFASPAGRMNLDSSATSYDVALQSFGQGFDDFTVMSMALLASTIAGTDGALAAPSFEIVAQRKVTAPFISASAAAELRSMMRSVVEHGTAAGVFGSHIAVAGKTGTADRDVLVYDRQGQPVTYKDSTGKVHLRTQGATDSWFIGFAPADKPRIAFAVLIENGGQGAKSAAPIAAKIVDRCLAAGYVIPQTETVASGPRR